MNPRKSLKEVIEMTMSKNRLSLSNINNLNNNLNNNNNLMNISKRRMSSSFQ